MSVPSKSIDKNKRYAGVKANDFVNKARTNETSRAAARTQGWANLGKINSRRIPPPANLPSLKSETGTNTPLFDPTIPTGTSHGWTASGNQTPTNLVNNQTRPLTPSKQPTQQQLDSLPAHVSTPPPQIPSSSSSTLSTDIDKPRGSTTWSTITASNTTGHSNDQPPNLLGLNDFPRLVTQDNKNIKSQSDSLINSMSTTTQGPSFRPANLASWKEGGGRAQPMSNDLIKESNDNNNNNNLSILPMQSQMLPTNANTSLLQSQIQNPNNSSYMRMYQQQQQQQPPPQMWSYNVGNSYGPYGTNQVPTPMSMHQLHQQQQQQRISPYGNNAQSQSQQRLNKSTDYKTPTILRNKDIDDLSKLTDNVTWASASQEVNYEEKIRFSDDEDNDITDNNTNKSRRFNNSQQQQSKQTYPQVLKNNNNNNNRTLNTNYSQQKTTRSRLLQDDEHVKQMQDDKNSELINTLTVAKQRRDEQERNLRDTLSQRSTTVQKSFDDQKQIPGYQTRPLITSTGQDNLTTSSSSSPQIDSTSLWGQQSNTSTTSTSRPRHDTTDSQTFTMKSWSDQMDSFNYASLHEKSGGQVDTDDHHDDTPVVIASGSSTSHKYSRSQSESSSQSHTDNGTTINRSKHFLITNRKQLKSNINQMKTSLNNNRTKIKTTDTIDYFDNNNNNEQQIKSNDQWGDWEDTNNRYQQSYTNDRRGGHYQQNLSEDLSQKSNRHHEQTNDFNRTKQTSKARSNLSRSSDIPTSTKSETKTVTNKSQPAWRPLSPARPLDTNDPTPQESISYKSQTNMNDRRQSAPIERKQRYTPINTASIPPLMSVRSDVPPTSTTTTTSKQYKTSNQLQRQDYNSSSHYSQRNDFYNETNDSTWGNDDEYYDDETGYYDPNIQTHQRHHHTMGYHSNIHHRGYIALGSYGRYRRGGTLRHQQQYNTYNMNNTSGLSSQLNTSTGSKTKKTLTNRTTTTVTNNKKLNESSEQQTKNVVEPSKIVADEVIKKPPAWTTEKKPATIEEISKTKQPIETSSNSIEIEKPKESIINITSEQKNENESNNLVGQTDTESTITNKKPTTTTTTTNLQRKTNKDQQNYHQDQRYQNQQVSHHRNTYGRSMQDYDAMQMNAHNYYGTSRRTTRGGRNTRMHDLSGGYYYEHPQQRYNSRYNYLNEHYQQHPTHSTNKTTKRTGSSTTTTTTADRQQHKQQTTKGNNNNNNNNNTNLRPQSASDNEQKEGEEWETASESSANMRSTHTDANQQQSIKSTTNETKSTNRDRTPPKKSFSSQRPLNSRYNESSIYRRPHNIHERGSKTSRTIVHRTNRLSTNLKQNTQQKTDGEIATIKQTSTIKKDQHRHSLEGYDLNNVAGVVKIETLPASALEEESSTFDDGGEEFCVVMSKRGRKEQKAAQLSKQNAIESTNTPTTNITNDQIIKSTSITNDEQQTNEKTSNETNQTNTTRTRNGKSIPPRFNSKTANSTTRQHNIKNDHQNSSMYYYDQNYYYYDQNQYYDHDNSYYNYGNYNQSHRQQQPSTRRKQRIQQNNHDIHPTDEHLNERQKNESNISEKSHSTSSSNVMSNIQMWDPHTDNTISNSSKLIEKPTHDRKFGNELVPSSSSNDPSLPLHQRTATDLTTHSTVSKATETIARTIKPPITDNKSTRDNKTKSTTYEKNDAISSLGSNQLFEKSTFLDYDDKQSIGTVGDDYNQKINSLKTIWDASEHPSVQLEQTINTMVAMKQKQKQQSDNNISNTNSTKTDNYVQESKSASSTNITVTNTNVSSTTNDDTNNKITTSTGNLQSTGSSSTINQPPSTYSTSTVTSKNEQKNICTVKPTQQVAPNIQDQVDVTSYQTFAVPPLVPPISQTSLQQQQQQHILPQSQVNPLHQQHSYQFYENILTAPPPPPIPQQQPPPQQQQQFNRYAPQNFPYRNTNVFLPPPNVPNTNSMYHHTSQGSISAPPQNNAMQPPPMTSYPSPFLVDHGGHMISQPQPPPQAYMNNQMMSGRPQGAPYYRTPPQQQLQTPPAPPYGTQDPLAHGGFYPQFYQPPPNSNAPPVGHPSPHNLYGQNEGFHPAHPQMFARAGSIDRNDHPLMSQPPPPPPQSLSRPTNYPSTSSNQQQQQGPPPSLLSQNLKSFHTNQQQASSSNQAPFYPPPPNQYTRQPMPIGAMNTTNNRQQTQQVPSLMSGLSKNFSNNANNLNNTQSLFQHRQPLIPSQSNNNRPLYQHHTTPYSNYSKSTGPNDDNIKPKHI